MKARLRFVLAVVVLGLLMTGPFLLTAALIWLDAPLSERERLVALIGPRLPLGALLTAVGFLLGLAVVSRLFSQYVEGLLRMGEHLRLMLTANRDWRVADAGGPPEVRQLAAAVNALAGQRDVQIEEIAAQVAAAKASVEEEKSRLAALMSELAQAVVVCNRDGRILLYNRRARLQFRSLAGGADGVPIGLGRTIFALFERAQLEHALDIAQQRQAAGKAALASFVTATRGDRLLRVQLVPVKAVGTPEGAAAGGYVLCIDDITRSMEEAAARDRVIHALSEGMRGGLAVVRSAAANLVDYPDMEGAARERFLRMIADATGGLAQRLNATLDEFSASLKVRWPLEDAAGADFVAVAARRVSERIGLPTRVDEIDAGIWIRVDSYALIFAICFLAERLQEHYGIRDLRLRLTAEARLAALDLVWTGSNVSPETFYAWELESMQAGGENTTLTLRDVIQRHGGEFWCQREKAAATACFRFMLPLATPDIDDAAEAASERPEYYDFDLFARRDPGFDLDAPLASLNYSVFDTETTGLDPAGGDAIVQIGALRIVNGRVLAQEKFVQLVDPERSLPAASVAIHGITEAALRGQPKIAAVLPRFHAFCADTVLVAHNAAFDMRFLQLQEEATGVQFTQPVLDTLLLSAVVHPHQESHSLEAIARRLGVTVIGRHDALADARVTGEIFVRLLPLLAEKGVVSLRQAQEASRRTYFARIKY